MKNTTKLILVFLILWPVYAQSQQIPDSPKTTERYEHVPTQHQKQETQNPAEATSPSPVIKGKAVEQKSTPTTNKEENEKKGEFTDRLMVDPIYLLTAFLVLATFGLWYATYQLVVGAENTAKRQLRAYVAVPTVTVRDEKRQNGLVKSFIHITIRNFGQTPASHCSYWLDICSQQLPLTSNLARPKLAKDSGIGVIAPTDTFTVRTEFPLLPNDGEIYAGRYAMYVHGQFCYTDAFGARQTTEFRFMRNGEGWTSDGEMEICEEGNEAT